MLVNLFSSFDSSQGHLRKLVYQVRYHYHFKMNSSIRFKLTSLNIGVTNLYHFCSLLLYWCSVCCKCFWTPESLLLITIVLCVNLTF